MSLFIQTAHAAGAAPAGQPFWFQWLIMAFFLVVFYLLIWRPQSKRQKEHKNMVTSVKEGTEIVFAGGLMGTIKVISEDYVVVALNEKNKITIQKASIIAVLPEGTISGIECV